MTGRGLGARDFGISTLLEDAGDYASCPGSIRAARWTE
jgi:hypothetical protein